MTPISLQGQGPILIAGQTASGKSGLALAIAREVNGVVVNADSMQVYADLQVLTARPTHEEMQGIPHRLYGHVRADMPYSVGRWLADMENLLAELNETGLRPVIVGGTGLYFKALLEGLAPHPEIPSPIREKWRRAAEEPGIDLHALLALQDPQGAKRLNPSDRHRLTRALEVLEATGKPLAFWQERARSRENRAAPLIDADNAVRIVIDIEREALYQRCDLRFDQMMQHGALQEVERLIERALQPDLPAMRALGVRPLARCLAGEIDLDTAVELAKTETRQYAKRQMTWLRGNMLAWKWLNLKEVETDMPRSLSFI